MKKFFKLTFITGIIFSLIIFSSFGAAAASCPLTNLFFGNGGIGSLFGGSTNNIFSSLFGNTSNNNSSCSSSNISNIFGNSNIFGGSNSNTGNCTTGNCTTGNCLTNAGVTGNCTTNTCTISNCTTNTCTKGNNTINTCTTGNCTLTNCTDCKDCSLCPECPQCESDCTANGTCITNCTLCTNCEDCPECPQCEEEDETVELEKGYTYSLKFNSNGNRSFTVSSSDTSVATARLRTGYINGTAIVYVQAKKAGSTVISICPANNPQACEYVYINVIDNSAKPPSTNGQLSSAAACDSFAEEILVYVNEARAKNGLSALMLDSTLCEAAKVRAGEIAVKFSHTRPDGSSYLTVLNDFNIKYNSCGENLALGYNDAKTVVNGWMNSSSHRANILNPNYKYMGLGKVNTGWGQLFIG